MFRQDWERRPFPRRKFWFFLPFLFLAVLLLVGWAVQFLWNFVLPSAVGVRQLDYPQALALLVLCRILFGGFGGKRGGGGRPPFGGRWASMNDEERARFRESWEARCRKKED